MGEAVQANTLPWRRAFSWGRVVVLSLLGLGLLAAVTSDTLHAFLLSLLNTVSEVVAGYPVWGAVLFVVMSAAAAMLAFFSTAVLVPVAVVTWGQTGTFVLLWVGWILGGVCAYTVARHFGRPVVGALTSGDALACGDRISEKASFGFILLFQLGCPSEIPGYVLGLLRYSFLKYVTALGLAELPYAIATVYLGVSFLERRTFLFIVLGVAVGALSFLAFRLLQKHLAGAA